MSKFRKPEGAAKGSRPEGPEAKTPAKSSAAPSSTPGAIASAESRPGKLGVLKEIRKDVLVSTAGLIYSRGSIDGHRLDHVLEHARDRQDKPVHGVFIGDKQEILAVIDEAYLLAEKRGPPQVKKQTEDDRTVYLINMNRKIGYLGGQVGRRKNNPPCQLLQLVLEGKEVITAFPTDR